MGPNDEQPQYKRSPAARLQCVRREASLTPSTARGVTLCHLVVPVRFPLFSHNAISVPETKYDMCFHARVFKFLSCWSIRSTTNSLCVCVCVCVWVYTQLKCSCACVCYREDDKIFVVEAKDFNGLY
ncbi:unnamed protein product [Boreogadus saida]